MSFFYFSRHLLLIFLLVHFVLSPGSGYKWSRIRIFNVCGSETLNPTTIRAFTPASSGTFANNSNYLYYICHLLHIVHANWIKTFIFKKEGEKVEGHGQPQELGSENILVPYILQNSQKTSFLTVNFCKNKILRKQDLKLFLLLSVCQNKLQTNLSKPSLKVL